MLTPFKGQIPKICMFFTMLLELSSSPAADAQVFLLYRALPVQLCSFPPAEEQMFR